MLALKVGLGELVQSVNQLIGLVAEPNLANKSASKYMSLEGYNKDLGMKYFPLEV